MTSQTSGGPCTICGGKLASEVLRIRTPDRFERHLGIPESGYSRSWVECDRCGALTDVQLPENRALLDSLAAGYYEVDLAGSSIRAKYDKVMSLPPNLSDNAARVSRIHAFMDGWPIAVPNPAALDIGAGTGVFLSRFLKASANLSWTAVAVEPDPIAAEHLRTIGQFAVVEALFSGDLDLGRFDLVTLNKVVEHLPDPVNLVRSAASALRDPLGVVYVEVPDRLTVSYRPPTDNILGALHCHLYDPASLATLFSRAGLVTIRIERVFEPSGKISVAGFATTRAGADKLAEQES